MRSSKSRSRSKSNRSRAVGNIVNRVFDSSGPEGKVRGTPQQIIDKYNQLARDAQLSNDRVAAENFQQHAEHYMRMLSEAQREQDARREQQEAAQNRDRQQPRNGRDDGEGQNGGDDRDGDSRQPDQQAEGQRDDRQREDRQRDDRRNDQPRNDQPGEDRGREAASGGSDDVIDVPGESDSGLVETPESRPRPRRRSRKAQANGEDHSGGSDDSKEAAE